MSSQNNKNNDESLDRRGFLKSVSATSLTLGAATQAFAAKSIGKMSNRVIGANDRINVGVIGCGGRGRYDAQAFAQYGVKNENSCQIVARMRRVREAQGRRRKSTRSKATWTIANCSIRSEIDAVVIATPDHWHGKMAMDAMDTGKDVYLEKPMVHTNEEARQLGGHGEGDQADSAGRARRPRRRISGGRRRRPSPTA